MKYRNIIIGFDEMEQDQIEWIIIREQILKLYPRVNIIPDKKSLRYKIYRLKKTKVYRYIFYTLIILNAVSLSLVWHR